MKESLLGFSIDELMKLRKAMNKVDVDIEYVIDMIEDIPEPTKIVLPSGSFTFPKYKDVYKTEDKG